MTTKIIDKHDIERRKPVKRMLCCCCGGVFKGRQHWNQDTGHGLGDCCVEYCKRGFSNDEEGAKDFERTYGIDGIHYNIEDKPK